MIRPGPNYKMSKPHKMMLANIRDPHLRGEIKRSIIQADLENLIKPKTDKNFMNKDMGE